MLTLETMQKVRAFASRDDLHNVTSILYDFGAIQVQECKLTPPDSPMQDFQEISEMLIRLRAEERLLELKGTADWKELSLGDVKSRFSAIPFSQVDENRKKLQETESKIQQLLERKNSLMPFKRLGIRPDAISSEKLLFSYFEIKPGTGNAIRSLLRKIPNELLFVEDGKKHYALLAFDTRQNEKVQAVISKNALTVHEIPKIDRNFNEELQNIDAQLLSLSSEKGSSKSWLESFRKSQGGEILELKEALNVLSLKSELPFKFGRTDYFSVVEGWIEKKNYDDFKARVEALGSCHVEAVKTKETPPSKLNNPKLIRPFEFMVEFFSLPKSNELDPTLFIAITFPLFFGSIMGDIGYGIICLLAAMLIKLKSKEDLMKRIGGMLALSAFSAIVFGIIYGEFFGLEHMFGIELHPLIHRAKEFEEMANFALLVGVLHLALGFIIGAYTNFIHKHYKHMIAKLAWLVLEISLVTIILYALDISLLEILSPLKHVIPLEVALGALLVCAFLIGYLESPVNLFEIPTLISNIFSYLRIVALGLSGVVLVLIINQLPVDFDGFFAMVTFQKPFDLGAAIMFVLFATVLVLGHILSLVLAILESSVQSLRLHYVEFFSKFYEGGGLPFVPLREGEIRRKKSA
ncbi:MAG: V-type ATP synthase subunit I [Candidatus Micrarchaeota archaeon]